MEHLHRRNLLSDGVSTGSFVTFYASGQNRRGSSPESDQNFTDTGTPDFLQFCSLPVGISSMRGAFVVRLAAETEPARGRFEGWVEEVDSGSELKFRSAEELLRFLGQRFEAEAGGKESA